MSTDKKIFNYIPQIFVAVIGITGIFIWVIIDSAFAEIIGVISIVLLYHLALISTGKLINRKFNVKEWIKRACSVLLTILDLLVLFWGFIYVAPEFFLFYNVKCQESYEYLQDKESYCEIKFTAENGKTYHGMMHQESSEKENSPLIIYFGGNGEVSHRNLRMRETNQQWAYFTEYNYLYVDYEGYGFNDGRSHYLNMYEQALAAYDYAVTLPNIDSNRIVVMGYSIGTGNAVYLAAKRPVAGLILGAPYANGYDLYNNILPIFYGPVRLLVRQKFPSDEYACEVTCPVLIIASHNDETVPFSSSERLSKLFSVAGYVDFMELENASHNYIFQADGVFDRVRSFLKRVS